MSCPHLPMRCRHRVSARDGGLGCREKVLQGRACTEWTGQLVLAPRIADARRLALFADLYIAAYRPHTATSGTHLQPALCEGFRAMVQQILARLQLLRYLHGCVRSDAHTAEPAEHSGEGEAAWLYLGTAATLSAACLSRLCALIVLRSRELSPQLQNEDAQHLLQHMRRPIKYFQPRTCHE